MRQIQKHLTGLQNINARRFYWLTLFALALMSHSAIYAQETGFSSIGELELESIEGKPKTSALLLDTEVQGHIEGLVIAVTVNQVFRNPSNDWQHGRYVFPLPPTAAIDSLAIKVGDRIIRGKIEEKRQAQKTFEAAKREGKKAGLLEQHRPNLFSIAVANIAPQELITAQITYLDKIEFKNDQYSYRFPTTLTPRYIPDATSEQWEISADPSAANEPTVLHPVSTSQLSDTDAITPPQTHDLDRKTSHAFSLELSLNAGFKLESVRSMSHRLNVNYPSAERATISLANGKARLNGDLTLDWQVAIGEQPAAQLFEQQASDGVYSLITVQAPPRNNSVSLPKNVTFIIDSSGSMAGEPMRQAKQALLNGLKLLSPQDQFNVIDFDSEARPLFSAPQFANQNTLARAASLVQSLDADGGTEMMSALQLALNETVNEEANTLRQIIFITDGAVGNEQSLFALIHQNLGDARLFTVGIGAAPNTYFMNKAAQFGRGTSTMIADLNEVNQRVSELFRLISAPVLRDIQINLPKDAEMFPARLPDLYQGEPLKLLVKSKKSLGKLALTGRLQQHTWRHELKSGKVRRSIKTLDHGYVPLNKLWARDKIAALMDELSITPTQRDQLEAEVLRLGLKHQLLTQFTSFVAVEERVSRPSGTASKDGVIPNLMPKGATMAMPQTATWTDLLLWLGILFILLGVYLGRKGVRYE